MFPGQTVNGNSGAAVGPAETMSSGLPGQGVDGDRGAALETMFEGSLGSELTVIVEGQWLGGELVVIVECLWAL